MFGALREFVPMPQVLFGSDTPYVSDGLVAAEVSGIDNSRVLDDEARAAINRDNALRLFPKFAKARLMST